MPGGTSVSAPFDFDVIAYAGNAEDVVLLRAFADHRGGFFVDVGAGDPTFGSVTKNLVDRLGWHGINIEPLPECRARLESERPRDVNLTVAIDEQAGTSRFHRIVAANGLVGGPALSTLDAEVVARHRAAGWGVEELDVETVPLSEILIAHASRPVDLLKVDVEGAEARVLRSAELERWRPRVVLVEATLPHTTVPSHEEWEPLVFDAGYRLALFDGVNRFYALGQEDELLRRLAVPANVSDRFVPHRFAVALGAARSRVIGPRHRLAPPALPGTRVGVASRSPTPSRAGGHVRAELRKLESSILAPETLESFQPESDDHFGILIDAEIAPSGEEGGERFSFTACTASWLTEVSPRFPEGFRWERARLVLPAWDIALIRRAVTDLCRHTSGEDWADVANKLNRFMSWQFEDPTD